MADQSQLKAPDVYERTHQMDEATLAVMAERLEARGRHPFFARAIGEYMDHLALTGTEAIIDIGCGTGVAARAIARRPEVRGSITAIDISRRARPDLSRPYIVADIGRADYCAPMIASFRVMLPKVGVMSQAEAGAFVDGLERASAENRFFGASNFYTYVARRDG
jgi:SAM-dependent methyltransferase